MCGRFTQRYTWSEVHEFLSAFGTSKNLQPRYNIAPTTPVDVVRLDPEARRELVSMRWGLVPYFWKRMLKEVPATFNARAETVADQPMFRDSFKRRRCIIPASGFFEWTGGKVAKIPHLFTAADGSPVLAFAGLWDRWKDPAREDVLSCTIIVSGASEWMAPYHDPRSHAGPNRRERHRGMARRVAGRGSVAPSRREHVAGVDCVDAPNPNERRRRRSDDRRAVGSSRVKVLSKAKVEIFRMVRSK